MIRRLFHLLAAWIGANAPRGDLVPCGRCGTGNEPFRTSCRSCGAPL